MEYSAMNSADPSSANARFKWLKLLARTCYFLASIVAILGSFVHLDIRFKAIKCPENKKAMMCGENDKYLDYKKFDCVGRNLIWIEQSKNQLKCDSNAYYWRGVFTFAPDTFADVWTPFVFSFVAFFQHFVGGKIMLISGSWFRALFFIIVWHLFGIIGYAANWGVFTGMWGILLLGILYLLMCVLGEVDEDPALAIDAGYYFKFALHSVGIGPAPQRKSEKGMADEDDIYGRNRKSSGPAYQAIDDGPASGATGGGGAPGYQQPPPAQQQQPIGQPLAAPQQDIPTQPRTESQEFQQQFVPPAQDQDT